MTACTPSACRAGSGTQNGHRKHGRNSRTPPPRRQPSPENPRSLCSRPASPSRYPRHSRQEGGTAPRMRGRGSWNRTPPPLRHAGRNNARNPITPSKTDSKNDTEHKGSNTPKKSKRLKYKSKTPKVRGVGLRASRLGANRMRAARPLPANRYRGVVGNGETRVERPSRQRQPPGAAVVAGQRRDRARGERSGHSARTHGLPIPQAWCVRATRWVNFG